MDLLAWCGGGLLYPPVIPFLSFSSQLFYIWFYIFCASDQTCKTQSSAGDRGREERRRDTNWQREPGERIKNATGKVKMTLSRDNPVLLQKPTGCVSLPDVPWVTDKKLGRNLLQKYGSQPGRLQLSLFFWRRTRQALNKGSRPYLANALLDSTSLCAAKLGLKVRARLQIIINYPTNSALFYTFCALTREQNKTIVFACLTDHDWSSYVNDPVIQQICFVSQIFPHVCFPAVMQISSTSRPAASSRSTPLPLSVCSPITWLPPALENIKILSNSQTNASFLLLLIPPLL